MKRTILLIILFAGMGVSTSVNAQWIAPGELSESHKKFEGLRNCAKCHELGKGPTVEKCLVCHEDIAFDLKRKTGYHGRAVRQKECWACHSEHRGRKYELIRFNKKQFNHDQTDFPLTGSHIGVKCTKCHTTSKYRETPSTCEGCHTPEHGNRYGTNCTECHSTKKWETLTFDHASTRFALKGKHVDIACKKCHTTELKTYKQVVRFEDCSGCHKDPHRGQFSDRACSSCHIETSFHDISSFDHNKTAFPLTGAHVRVRCQDCHKNMKIFKGAPDSCQSCHANPHKKIPTQNCSRCHTPQSWKVEKFNHAQTGFPLLGKHALSQCRDCHKKGVRKKIKASCDSCHKSPHPKKQRTYATCDSCHGYESWKVPEYDHRVSGYTLAGAHLKLLCNQCHTPERGLHIGKKTCLTCHADPHQKAFGKICEQCHEETSWKTVSFDHTTTKFPLKGKHNELDCLKCHMKPTYKVKGLACLDCHKDPHNGRFGKDCARCHTPSGWKLEFFDHSKTGFPLTGKHSELKCDACHKDWKRKLRASCESCHSNPHEKKSTRTCKECHDPKQPWAIVTYTHENTDLFAFHVTTQCSGCHLQKHFNKANIMCVNCHEDYHQGAMGQDCFPCHQSGDWNRTVFSHMWTGFPLVGAHLNIECGDCHRDLQTYRIIPRPMNCADCHEVHYRQSRFSHARYGAALDCQECHLQDKWQGAHSPFWFNIQTGTHAGLACGVCHKVASDYFQYTCHDCHEGHEGDRGGRCLDCHIGGFEVEGD